MQLCGVVTPQYHFLLRLSMINYVFYVFSTPNTGGRDYLYELFRAEVKKQMHLRNLTYEDLSKMIGVKRCTVSAFMCGVRDSDTTAHLLAKALDIEL